MKTLYQRANRDSSGNICYLGSSYESLYSVIVAIHHLSVTIERVADNNRKRFEEIRGRWPARIETADRSTLETTFHPVLTFRTPNEDNEITLGYIEHTIY